MEHWSRIADMSVARLHLYVLDDELTALSEFWPSLGSVRFGKACHVGRGESHPRGNIG